MNGESAVIHNCSEFLEKLGEAAKRCGRNIEDITVVAVSKTRPLEDVLEAVTAGMKHFGENRMQEAERKYAGIARNFRLHMIGHLQSNKVRDSVALFDVIQSVDSLRLAEILEREFDRAEKTGEIMLEVNTSGEPQKYGFAPQEVVAAADTIFEMGHVRLTGLMTVGPLTEDEAAIRDSFGKLRQLFNKIASNHSGRKEFAALSMGMSDDYEIAVEEGATMIRVGRALFGPRMTQG
jgi:pyridoxal phosphate enzyme (YggS family)